MTKRLLGVLAFALAVSAGAAFVLYQLIASRMTVGASTRPATTKVWVASKDLETGALITERELSTQEYLSVPPGAITKKEDIINRGVIAPIHEDSPFYEASLAPKGAGAGFAATIPKGLRAFTVKVNEVIGVAGFAVAGMHVDVLFSGQPPAAEGAAALGSITRTLLQDIQVLSAGQNYQKDAEGKPVIVQVVNLLVTPEQAELLTLAAQQTIQLVLRNPADREVVNTPGAATANLFGGRLRAARLEVGGNGEAAPGKAPVHAPPVAPPPPAPKPRTITVEVFSGTTRTQSTFIDPNSAPGPVPAEVSRP